MISNRVTVVDESGAEWTVGRRMYPYWNDDGGAQDAPYLYMVFWPLWFVAHWFGWPWMVDVVRDEVFVSEEKVRGWRDSGRRIRELADAAVIGDLAGEANKMN